MREMTPVRIALVLDNPYRDLAGMVLLARELCLHGATCHIVPMNLQVRELGALAPDFVLLPYLRRSNQNLAMRMMDAGATVAVLDTEGGVLQDLGDYDKLIADRDDVRQRIARICTWGETLTAHARERRWYRDDQMVVTGSPRFDFYAPPWRDAAVRLSSYAAGYGRPMVLINTNFSIINPMLGSAKTTKDYWVRHHGRDPSEVDRYHEVQRESLRKFAELTNRLARRFPKVAFVLRPHPFEETATYDELLDQRSNLFLKKEGTVDGWLLRADALIQRSCTTGIEARMAGIPTLSPRWIPTAELKPTAEAVSFQCVDEADMESRLEACLATQSGVRPEPDCYEEVVRDWFMTIDGRAHKRVTAALLPFMDASTKTVARRRRWRDIHFSWRRPRGSLRARLAGLTRKSLGLPVTWSFRQRSDVSDVDWWDRTPKAFDAQQVSGVLAAIESCANGDASGQPRLQVSAARERDDYLFGYRLGRSVTIAPAIESG